MSDWVDVAWNYLLSQAPMMADPARYRTMMYEVFWLGQEATLTPEEQKAARESGRSAGPDGKHITRQPTTKDLDAMKALLDRAAELRGELGSGPSV